LLALTARGYFCNSTVVRFLHNSGLIHNLPAFPDFSDHKHVYINIELVLKPINVSTHIYKSIHPTTTHYLFLIVCNQV